MSSQIPECMVPISSTFPDSFVNTSMETDRFARHQASPNVYDQVLNVSCDTDSSGHDMAAVGEGSCWVCDEMAGDLCQCEELGEMGN
ncbi:hypothetical protein V6N13_042200 [Hibiscus sabdariffa]|uniref:Uncharacterized protein n=1 Tax=Hibiscus sabdariffa TaxID=183260 RepID=A0ABR2DFB4_9ROSI